MFAYSLVGGEKDEHICWSDLEIKMTAGFMVS